jgi:periplasmic divalent cation tolerance protein
MTDRQPLQPVHCGPCHAGTSWSKSLASKEFLVVLSTCPDTSVAEDLATAALAGGHAACVNIVPGIRSMYVWKGAVQAEDEVLLLIKTTVRRFPALRELLVAKHPYDLPEVVAIGIEDGHHPYLDWIAQPGGPAGPDES